MSEKEKLFVKEKLNVKKKKKKPERYPCKYCGRKLTIVGFNRHYCIEDI
jgi:aspartate carbamoyltransferase regulatory subunit